MPIGNKKLSGGKAMKNRLAKRVLSFFLVLSMVFGSIPGMSMTAFAAEGGTTSSGLDTSNLTFDVEDPDGYVTISFEDNGIRPENAEIDNEKLYGEPLGTIIPATEVPFKKGDNMADVTIRLLDAMGIEYDSTGTADDGFYLAALLDFELNDTYYPTLGEFDAGSQSGWCVKLNNWHTNQGASAFEVEDEDVIKWQYTCQFGADIGADFSSKSAEITGIDFTEEYGTLSPAFDTENENYTYEVSEDISSLAFEVLLKNYASVVTVKVDGETVKYRPDKNITVKNNSVIEISTKLEYMDAADNNKVTEYTDKVQITLTPPNQAPSLKDGYSTEKDYSFKVGEKLDFDLSTIFEDKDGDSLSYTVSIAGGEAADIEENFSYTFEKEGTYQIIFTANDGKDTCTFTANVTVAAEETEENTAPAIKAEYAETKGKTYVYSSSYVYIYMDDIFEDADGDTLTYKATCNGEDVSITYNSWSKQYYIQFAEKPVIKEYKITANDGKADSEVFTATCIGTSATISLPEDSVLMENGSYYYYIYDSAENNTFSLNYKLDVDTDIVPEWFSSNNSVITVNDDGTFTVNEVTSRTQATIGVTYGKDEWGSTLYLGNKSIYILPNKPEIADVSIALPEHADNVTDRKSVV